jgi:hypothetical protein
VCQTEIANLGVREWGWSWVVNGIKGLRVENKSDSVVNGFWEWVECADFRVVDGKKKRSQIEGNGSVMTMAGLLSPWFVIWVKCVFTQRREARQGHYEKTWCGCGKWAWYGCGVAGDAVNRDGDGCEMRGKTLWVSRSSSIDASFLPLSDLKIDLPHNLFRLCGKFANMERSTIRFARTSAFLVSRKVPGPQSMSGAPTAYSLALSRSEARALKGLAVSTR